MHHNLNSKLKELKVFNILCLTTLKQLTRIWKQTKIPKLCLWYDTIEQVFEMERLTLVANGNLERWDREYFGYIDKVTRHMRSHTYSSLFCLPPFFSQSFSSFLMYMFSFVVK